MQWVSLEDTVADPALLLTAVRVAIPRALAAQRSPQPIASLCLALQCGGSDAFSGITANPLQGAIAEEVIHRGGSAILAETDELIGADAYILDKVRDVATARKFMATQARYEHTANVVGVSAQANPSGGNFYRGLYNIAIKSLGAAMKKTASTRLEGVLEYAERIGAQGAQRFFERFAGSIFRQRDAPRFDAHGGAALHRRPLVGEIVLARSKAHDGERRDDALFAQTGYELRCFFVERGSSARAAEKHAHRASLPYTSL